MPLVDENKQELIANQSIRESLNHQNTEQIKENIKNPEFVFTKEQLNQFKNADVIFVDLDSVLSMKNEQGKTGYEQINEGIENSGERINPTYMKLKDFTSKVFNGVTNILHKIIDNTVGKLAQAAENTVNSDENIQKSAEKTKENIKEIAKDKLEKSDSFINASFNRAENVIKQLREYFPDKAIIVTCAENTKHNIQAVARACADTGIYFAQKGTEKFKELMQKPVECYKNAKNMIEAKKDAKKMQAEINKEINERLNRIEKKQDRIEKKLDSLQNNQSQSKGHSR